MEKFILNITASSGEFFQGECESLTLPTADGQYGVQAGHSPVLVALEMGIMQFTVNGETRNVLVGDGIAEVTPAYVMLLVDSAERPEDIDKNRAEAARIRERIGATNAVCYDMSCAAPAASTGFPPPTSSWPAPPSRARKPPAPGALCAATTCAACSWWPPSA